MVKLVHLLDAKFLTVQICTIKPKKQDEELKNRSKDYNM